MNLIILGPPGSGKGTLSKALCDHYQMVHISTGDLFRDHIQKQTELGRLASAYIERGDLVPDEVTIGMVRDRLSQLSDADGFLLDGFPRNVLQAAAFGEMMKTLGRKLDGAINVKLADDIISSRIEGRRICRSCGASYHIRYMPPAQAEVCDRCGGELYQRADDRAETVMNRLATYHEVTRPLIEYYEGAGLVIHVDNSGKAADTIRHLFSQLG